MARPTIVPGQRSIPLSTSVPKTLYDALYAVALKRRMTMAELTRVLLSRRVSIENARLTSTHPTV